jgi:hypothetical protein
LLEFWRRQRRNPQNRGPALTGKAMDVLGLSNAAAPLELKPLKRPDDASPPAAPVAAKAADAAANDAAPAKITQKTQLIVEQIDRFTFAYTFFDPETLNVVSRWPATRGGTNPGDVVDEIT